MSSNMTIPAANIGGNIVSPTPDGKIKVTTAKGKEKVLTQDQFIKSIKKNEENIKAGKDFEIKKDNKTAKIVGLVAAAAAVVTGVVYRKEIGKWFSKAADKVKDVVKGSKKATNNTIFSDTAGYTTAGKKAKNEAIVAMSKDNFGYEKTMKERAKMRVDAKHAFADYDGEAVLKGLKEGKKPEELGLTVKPRTEAIKEEKFVSLKDVPAKETTPAAKTPEAPKAEVTTEAKPKKKTDKKGKANAEKTEAAPKADKKAEQPKTEDKK